MNGVVDTPDGSESIPPPLALFSFLVSIKGYSLSQYLFCHQHIPGTDDGGKAGAILPAFSSM